ncbi:unnamed protein product [Blepharisma stoltei]|uniref:MOSC domain-containing protein n=1 Tax=Blepharisma stoltei TaxID=1481888 RepID=A0AAU9KHV3_9CILI|nr:unnamed protein product [Blepharisma stoltei]
MEIYTFLIIGLILCLIYFVKSKKAAPIVVSDIIIYPIKGCGSIHLKEGKIVENGLVEDRQWFIANDKLENITQRQNPKILGIQPRLIYNGEGQLTNMILSHEGMPDFSLEIKDLSDKETVNVGVWKCTVPLPSKDEGEAVGAWITEALKAPENYHLFRFVADWPINHRKEYQSTVSDEFKTMATDIAQFLVISEETYAECIRKLPEYKRDHIDIIAFRPNIMVKGAPRAFDEDWWENFKINDVNFQGIGRCSRCRVTTISQKTLEFDANGEPVSTLRKINGNGTKGYLGMHCVKTCCGTVRVGDQVQVVSRRKFPDI